ncbi:MAG: cytochrome b N-terminal domain-containing protein [Anaerolineales bacterium]|jgi:ubiquinol-cytochrome c reductase cytochrome b subunit
MSLLRRVWGWFDDRTGLTEVLSPIASHLVPPGTSWWYVFGSATLFAFIVQVVTGIALATMYVTSTAHAYQSLQFITQDALLGRVLRGIHFWGASAMVLFVGVHMIRVFLMGSYKFPREVNWLTGAGLLLFTIGMGFTGQLLRWDQNAVWSVVVGAAQAGRMPFIGQRLAQFILGGDVVGGATLSRFFSFHVFFIPALIFGFIGVHLYLVLRNGISEPPVLGHIVDPKTYRDWYNRLLEKRGIPFWPDVAWRDVIFGVAMVVGVVALAFLLGPPALGKPPDPSIVQADPRPDWYLLWYFAVLALIPPGIESWVIIGAPMAFGIAVILLPFLGSKGERHPLRRPWAIAIVIVAVMMVGTLWRLADQAPWSPNFSAQPLTAQDLGPTSDTVWAGSQLFYVKGCQFCHTVNGKGGQRGPDLSDVGSRLSKQQITLRILNGGTNMPSYAATMSPGALNLLVDFLSSRTGQ